MPEVSVLMSVYNGEEFLEHSINSILHQTFEDFEFIIVDDGSSDRTQQIIRSYNDARIKSYRFDRNAGVGAALHYGLKMTSGKYIAKADSDDIHVPDRLMKQKQFLDQNPDIALVRGFISYFPHNKETEQTARYQWMKAVKEGLKNRVNTPQDLAEKVYWTCCIPHTTIMVRSEAMKEVGYDPSLRIGEDYKLFYDLNKYGFKMAGIEEVLVHMRVSINSTTVIEESNYWHNVWKIKQEEITRLSRQGKRFFLWGAGGKGKALVEQVLPVQKLNIHGFIDSDPEKQKLKIHQYAVYSPDILEPGDTVLIVSDPGLYPIGEDLKRRGFEPLNHFIGFS